MSPGNAWCRGPAWWNSSPSSTRSARTHPSAWILAPGEDAAARVAELALKRRHPTAGEALDLFVRLYGAFAGNLALAGLTRGGVYLAGGIAPRILQRLRAGDFLEAFRAKGRFAPLMAEMPVHVVTHPAPGLLGATLAAAGL